MDARHLLIILGFAVATGFTIYDAYEPRSAACKLAGGSYFRLEGRCVRWITETIELFPPTGKQEP